MSLMIVPDANDVQRHGLRHYSRFIVSADLGQSIDPTAVAVLEVTTRDDIRARFWDAPESEQANLIEPPREWYKQSAGGLTFQHPKLPVFIDVRHLERLPLQMPYPAQVEHIARLVRKPELRSPKLVLDQTGVGRPIVDMFRRDGLKPIGCTITAGATEKRVYDEGGESWHVAKLLLVSRLQSALHSKVLRVAEDLPETRTLVSELQGFRGIFNDTGYARFGAREGDHDDLVLAVAMGVWYGSQGMQTTWWGTLTI